MLREILQVSGRNFSKIIRFKLCDMKGVQMKENKHEENLFVDKTMVVNGQKFEVSLVFMSPESEHETVADKIKHLINGEKIS